MGDNMKARNVIYFTDFISFTSIFSYLFYLDHFTDLRPTPLNLLPIIINIYILSISTSKVGVKMYDAKKKGTLVALYIPYFVYGVHFICVGIMNGFFIHVLLGILICIAFFLIVRIT